MRLFDKNDRSDAPTPFGLTQFEVKFLDPNYKKPKRKTKYATVASPTPSVEGSKKKFASIQEQHRLFSTPTISSGLKNRVSEQIEGIWDEIESDIRADPDDDDTKEQSATPDSVGSVAKSSKKAGIKAADSIYDMACIRRYISGAEPISKFVEDSRKMFLMQHSLAVKRGERARMDKLIRREERRLHQTESELRLAEQAFDQFLQEKDRNAVAAMKRADSETKQRVEKASRLKEVDNRIVTLKREINNLKDILAEYGTYQGFLSSLSPDSWKTKQGKQKVSKASLGDSVEDDFTVTKEIQDVLKSMGMTTEEIEKAKGEVKLFFHEPQQLLSIFHDLEDENLGLIQDCREAEGNLEKDRTIGQETRSRLDQQASNFELEIEKLEDRIDAEIDSGMALKKIQMEKKAETKDLEAAEAKKAEDKVLKELDRQVKVIYKRCVGKTFASPTPETSTLELLKRVELKMELLTQELERLPDEKVEIAQRTCEQERRQREFEANLERQKQIEADRNKKALDRALAPPYIKPELKALMPPSPVMRRRRPHRKMDQNVDPSNPLGSLMSRNSPSSP